MSAFRVLQLDHVELFVPERHEAARWYRRGLGPGGLPEDEPLGADPPGPPVISREKGRTKAALFGGGGGSGRDNAPKGSRRVGGGGALRLQT